jgi:DNA-binding beta-propeller fold protein YncE
MSKLSKPSLRFSGVLSALALCFVFTGNVSAEDNHKVVGVKIVKTLSGLTSSLATVALNEKENLIYLTGYDWSVGSGSLIVLDGDTHKIINQINTPTLNANIFADEETGTVWAFSNNAGATSYSTAIQFDGYSLKTLQTLQLPNIFVNAGAHNRKTGKYYITDYNTGNIVVYDRQINYLTTINDDNAGFVAVNEKTDKVYVTNYWDGTVSVIDGKTDTIVGNPILVGTPIAPNDCYKLAGYPYPDCNNYDSFAATDGIAVDEVNNRIAVANVNIGTFVIIDGNTNQVSHTVQLQDGTFAAATLPGLNTALVVNWDRSNVSFVNEQTGALLQTVQAGAGNSPNCLRIQWDGGSCSFWGNFASSATVSSDNRKIYVIAGGDHAGGASNSPSTDPYAASKLFILEPIFADDEK